MQDMLTTTIRSFTKQREYSVVIAKDYLGPADRGSSSTTSSPTAMPPWASSTSAARQAPSSSHGLIIEKAFQHGRERIEAEGVRCESLAIVERLDHGLIELRD
jgi:xanthine phosphoribosyltransferase